MGAGSKKGHESFGIAPTAPAVGVLDPEDLPAWVEDEVPAGTSAGGRGNPNPDDDDGPWLGGWEDPDLAKLWQEAGYEPYDDFVVTWGKACGFTPDDAATWAEMGFEPADAVYAEGHEVSFYEAQEWLDAGFEPADMADWDQAGFTPDVATDWQAQGFNAYDAAWWRDAGFDSDVAGAWKQCDVDPQEALLWANEGFDPEAMAAWQGHGFDFEGATDWSAQDFEPADASAWKQHGFNLTTAGAWAAEDCSPEVAAAWDGEEHGFLFGESVQWASQGFDPVTAQAWIDNGFDPTTAKAWTTLGYGAEKVTQAMTAWEFSPGPEGLAAKAALAQGLGPENFWATATTKGMSAPEPEPTPAPESTPEPTLGRTVSTRPADAAWPEAVTPVPEAPEAGAPLGTPLLVGGADLVGSAATLVSYDSPAGPHEVLMATVTEDGERNLMEALSVAGTKMVPVEVEKSIVGRLPLDTENQIHEQLSTAAKSVNHHLKAGDDIPAHTQENITKVKGTLTDLQNGSPTAAEATMLAAYREHLDALVFRVGNPGLMPYDEGGKVPTVEAYEMSGTVKVTEMMPVAEETLDPDQLVTSIRTATRISPTITGGRVSWNGSSRAKGKGKEYAIELGDGYKAVYHPYAMDDPASDHFSLRGNLEVIAPPGGGHGAELVDRMGRLNLVNRPLTKEEGEWAYLQANISAQGLAGNPGVAAVIASGDEETEAIRESLFDASLDGLTSLDEGAINALVRKVALEAEAQSLPQRVTRLRDAVAKATGLTSGDELAARPGYDPTPRRSAGWLTWDRFDVAGSPATIDQAMTGKSLVHRVAGGAKGIIDMLENGGALASNERRRRMGMTQKGTSEGADMISGGASSVFLRVKKSPHGGYEGHGVVMWDDPSVLLRRSDWYAYENDHFGSLNPHSGNSTVGMTTDPHIVAGFSSGQDNEVMFWDGIDLLGDEAPSRIRCGTAEITSQVRAWFADHGITHLRGRPVDKVVKAKG
ncbi:MAG: hypothetical protein ACRD0J_02840 [Acidimicrobiales bacterium]